MCWQPCCARQSTRLDRTHRANKFLPPTGSLKLLGQDRRGSAHVQDLMLVCQIVVYWKDGTGGGWLDMKMGIVDERLNETVVGLILCWIQIFEMGNCVVLRDSMSGIDLRGQGHCCCSEPKGAFQLHCLLLLCVTRKC